MFLHPAIIAILLGSVLTSGMLFYSLYYGVSIFRNWDIKSGSELQLSLERKTYLVSTMVIYAFGFQLLSLFLFIYTVDHMAPLFVGAMCAAGSLNANQWGYPTIIVKIVNFILAGLWLIVNFADNKAYDYPLIRTKYLLLMLIFPVVIAELALQGSYFFELEPNVITSCCGTLFTSDAGGVTSGILALPHGPVEAAFYSCMAGLLCLSAYFYKTRHGAYLLAAMSFIALIVSIAALISFISLYFYELPTHHCPFCILQREYLYMGYPLYICILGGAVFGMGIGVIAPFSHIESLKEVVPAVQSKLVVLALGLNSVALAIVLYEVAFSNLKLW